jgi:hypothetical protein
MSLGTNAQQPTNKHRSSNIDSTANKHTKNSTCDTLAMCHETPYNKNSNINCNTSKNIDNNHDNNKDSLGK